MLIDISRSYTGNGLLDLAIDQYREYHNNSLPRLIMNKDELDRLASSDGFISSKFIQNIPEKMKSGTVQYLGAWIYIDNHLKDGEVELI